MRLAGHAAGSVLGLALLGVCATTAAQAGDGRTRRLLDRSLMPGARIVVEGQSVGEDAFRADEIELEEEDDDDIELRGSIEQVDPVGRTLRLLGVVVHVDEKTRYLSEPDHPATFADLQPGLRVKIEGERERNGEFEADEIRIRRNQEYRERKVAGLIESVAAGDAGTAVLRVGGIRILVDPTTELVASRGRTRPALQRRVGVVDDDDLLFTNRTRLGRRIAVAGEVRVRGELLRELDLEPEEDDDVLIPELTGVVGFAIDLGPAFGYVELLGEQQFVIESAEDPLGSEGDLRVGEAYLDLPTGLAPWLSVAIGRQKFNEEREWHYNTKTLDAVRFLADFAHVAAEASLSRDLFDQQRNLRDQDTVNTMVHVRSEVFEDIEVEGYFIDRDDRTPLDDSPRLFGARLLGEPGRHFELWADLAVGRGTTCTRPRTLEDPPGSGNLIRVDSGQPCGREIPPTDPVIRSVRAHAFDLGLTYRPRVALDPTFTLGYALGSGEGDGGAEQLGRTARSFRQSGMQRNRGKYHGVVSFRYYGEVLDPELTNLRIATLGVGLRPGRSFSVDVIFHDYRQDETSGRFHVFEVDEEPSGLDPHIGDAWDLIVGYEPSRRFELRLTAGWFRPGGAFDAGAPDARSIRAQAKFRF